MNVNDKKTLNCISKILFISYMIIFIWIVIFKCGFVDDLKIKHQIQSRLSLCERIINTGEIKNLIYRIQIGEYFHRGILEPFLNIIIFIPVGIYITFFQKEKRIFNTYITSVVISLAIELTQLATMIGGFSFLDLVTNVAGGLIGCLIYHIIYDDKRIRVLNIASIVSSIFMVSIALFAIYNTIINIQFYIDVALRRL